MRYIPRFILTIAAMFTTMNLAAQEVKQCYGFIDDPAYAEGHGIYTFDFDGQQMTNIHHRLTTLTDQTAGACMVNGVYYWFDYTLNSRGHTSNGFYSYDTETGEVKQIANYGNEQGGNVVSHLCYDYTTRTMYGIWGPGYGLTLGKIDLETGEMTRLSDLHMEVWPSIADSLYENGLRVYAESVKNMVVSLAISYDGDMYALEFCGGLYRVNKTTGDCTYIGRLNHLKENDFRYDQNNLFFDNDSEKLYLRAYSKNRTTGVGCVYLQEVDPKTAHTIPLQEWVINDEDDYPHFYQLFGIHVPFLPAEASAPAKVTDVIITPGAEGALTATLEWDNPSKTYARGGTLEELTAVVVYRDGEEVWRNDNPVIGGHESFTDHVEKRGFYDYRIIGFNSMGKGDRYNTSLFIGEDDPKAVGDLTVTSEGDGARLTWTAPTEGKYGAWINTATLRYDIVRQPDGVKVGNGITECTFLDDQIPEYERYQYEVTARTALYTGVTARTDMVAVGPSFQIPASFPLRDANKMMLWKIIDGNQNWYTWTMNPQVGEGAYCQYGNDGYAAHDWLISPRVAFKKDQHYKLTFEVVPGNKLIREKLLVAWGQGQEEAKQDSLTQFEILHDGPVTLRVNLPILSEDKDLNIGFLYRSDVVNYQLLLRDVVVDEDHEGYIDGHVTNTDGQPVQGAVVRAANGRYQARTDADGYYKLMYLPAQKYTIQVVCLGYQNKTASVTVEELKTTTQDMQITPLPAYALEGRVMDVAGDVVADAEVKLSGYDNRTTKTDDEGRFSFAEVFKSSNYTVTVTKLGYVPYSKVTPVNADVDMGTIELADDVVAPKAVIVSADNETATVSWRSPIGTPRLFRIDDGTYTTSLGYQSGATTNNVFGVINRTPATVYSVEYLLSSPVEEDKGTVTLRLIALDDEGMPNGNVLYETTIPYQNGSWTIYSLPHPVDAPTGYYTCIGYDGFLGIAIDGNGDATQYPFVKRVNCFGDYTKGEWYFLDNQSSAQMRHNFCIRTWADPYNEDSIVTPSETIVYKTEKTETLAPELTAIAASASIEAPSGAVGGALASPLRIVQDRVRYNVYRMTNADASSESAWTLLAENLQECSYADAEWRSLPQGVYRYAVKAVYTGDKLSSAAMTDSVGCKMLTQVRLHIATQTPDDESWGAEVTITDGYNHLYTTTVEDGEAVIDNVWKGHYMLTVSLDGFQGISVPLDLSLEDSYEFSYELTEIRVQPFNLMVEEVEGTEKAEMRFVWNFPDYFFDDFEEHEDFMVNSPGSIGWQYIDGDGCETGGFLGFEEWDCLFKPMAFCVFNAYNILSEDGQGTMADYMQMMRSHSGHKQLASFSADGAANDDWLITPRLYFKQPFTFSFYARSYDGYNYPELIEVRYSTTGCNKDDFTQVAMKKTGVKSALGETAYNYYELELPAEARYVAIHHMSDQLRVLSIDDVFVGLKQANSRSQIVNRQSVNRNSHKMPALEGQYEVYLDGQKVADTDETSYVFSHLTQGKHTAGVLASYTSGKTEMTTIDFDCQLIDGVPSVALLKQPTGRLFDLQGRRIEYAGQKGIFIMTDGEKSFKVMKK